MIRRRAAGTPRAARHGRAAPTDRRCATGPPRCAGHSERLHAVQVDLARHLLHQLVDRRAPARLSDLDVRQVDQVARVDGLVLESRRRRHHRPGDRAEIGALLEGGVVIQHAAGRPLRELQRHQQVGLELVRHQGAVERDRVAPVANDGSAQDQVALLVRNDLERAPAPELLLDGALQRHVQPLLARRVLEECDRDRARGRWDVRAGPGEPVAAAEREHREPPNSHLPSMARHTTRLTMRPGTSTCLRTGLSPSCARTRSSASAAASTSSAVASTDTVTRARTLPFTCTGSSIVVRTSAVVSAAGHAASVTGSSWPLSSHSSLATCGTKGASRSRIVSTASRSVAGSAVPATAAVAGTRSTTAAMAVLKCNRSTTSCVTRSIVWCASRCRSRSAEVDVETALPGAASRGPTPCTSRQTRPRNRLIPSTP